jgi:hypothetical protein
MARRANRGSGGKKNLKVNLKEVEILEKMLHDPLIVM